MGAGQVERLGGGDAGDQAVGDLGRGGDGRRVLGAGEDEVAMDLVGHQQQIVLGAKAGQRTNLVGRPHGAAWIVRAAEENDLGPRRQLLAQRGEVHGVAAVGLDQLRIEDAPLVGQDDAAEGVIGGREDDDLVAGGGGRLQDEAEPRHDAGRRADPVGIHAQAMPAGHPIRERGRPAAGVGVVAVGGARNLGRERFRHARRRGEIHVRDPHRDRVGRVDAREPGHVVPLGGVRAAALDDAVEIEHGVCGSEMAGSRQ